MSESHGSFGQRDRTTIKKKFIDPSTVNEKRIINTHIMYYVLDQSPLPEPRSEKSIPPETAAAERKKEKKKDLQVVGPCARSARIATTILLTNPAVKPQCLHCCVSAWRVAYIWYLDCALTTASCKLRADASCRGLRGAGGRLLNNSTGRPRRTKYAFLNLHRHDDVCTRVNVCVSCTGLTCKSV
ncbi:hypothetical protein MSG28_001225 [Choristoneura fumiferana]|uniref:Uncharacterized protein n=1 Tax=Choristoneura fumiferana TaxID=7141 RepID=A0ACC0K432_CHOFU|nr:hypothetical protein MSG28_001225 [Choristoneura fumiferana]